MLFFITIELQKNMYPELSQGMPLLGVDNNMAITTNLFPDLEAERTHIGEKVLIVNLAPVAQQFLKRGCPRALRGRIWSLVLGSVINDKVNMKCSSYPLLDEIRNYFSFQGRRILRGVEKHGFTLRYSR